MKMALRGICATVVLWVLLTACSGEDAPDESIPLPSAAPKSTGPVKGPAMQPRVLVEAADALDSTQGDVSDQLVDRTSGAVVTQSAVVAYAVDNISGYDIETGKQLWTAKIDFGTGTICAVSQPESPKVKTLTVVYGESGYCTGLATVAVADGKVVEDIDVLDWSFSGSGVEISSVSHLLTVGNTDFLVDGSNVVFSLKKGLPVRKADMGTDVVYHLVRVPGQPVVAATISDRDGEREECRLEGYSVPDFKKVWSTTHDAMFPPEKDCILVPVEGNGAWTFTESGTDYRMAQLDPMTGKVLGATKETKKSDGKPTDKKVFDMSYGANRHEATLGLEGGDVVFPQVFGLARYSLERDEMVWRFDGGELAIKETDEDDSNDLRPRAVTPDGRLVIATLTNATTSEVLAIDAKKGTLKGRWPLPKKYAGGFTVEPQLALFDDGVILTRDFDAWRREYLSEKDPAGDGGVFDVGIFTWPEPAAK